MISVLEHFAVKIALCIVLVGVVGMIMWGSISITNKYLENLENETAAKERVHAMICLSSLKACQKALELRIDLKNEHVDQYNECIDKVLSEICIEKERVDEIMDSIANSDSDAGM